MGSPRKRSLHSILERTRLGNKDDIAVCLTGHLNSENLLRLDPEPDHHVAWKTAAKRNVPLSKRVPLGRSSPAAASFSPPPFPSDDALRQLLGLRSYTPPPYDSASGASPSSSTLPPDRDAVCAEELRLPELMLPLDTATLRLLPERFAKLPEILRLDEPPRPKKEADRPESVAVPASTAATSRTLGAASIECVAGSRPDLGAAASSTAAPGVASLGPHVFVSTHVGAVTKKEEYAQMKTLSGLLVRPIEADVARSRRRLSGAESAERIERRLQRRLAALEAEDPDGARKIGFRRISVFAEAFDAVADACPSLRPLLQRIKENYEAHLTTLLDRSMANAGRTEALAQQAQRLQRRGDAEEDPLLRLRRDLAAAEKRAAKELARNDGLRRKLEDTRNKLTAGVVLQDGPSPLRNPYLRGPGGEPLVRVVSPAAVALREEAPEPPSTPVQRVIALHETISKQTDEIRDISKQLRTKHVPGTICQQLDRSLKETQYEMEKLEEVAAEVEGEVRSLEDSLRDWIRLADTSRRDEDRLWLALNSDEDDLDKHLEGDAFRHNEYFS